MDNVSYGFLPWLRLGMTRHITQEDFQTNNVKTERAAVTVTLGTSLGNITSNLQRELQLVGPGDIIGIDARVILRKEPQPDTFTFEANYLPFIEFYEEDFPWRYTPAVAPANPSDINYNRLRPWLALVVLKDGEFELGQPVRNGLPPVLNISAPLGTLLHPHEEHWAWAHVQMNQPMVNASNSPAPPMEAQLDNFKTAVKADPNLAFSRLMCSRRLEAGVSYTAFLIPAFETGRLAGLGEDSAVIAATSSLKEAWNLVTPNSTPNQISPNWFPVYHQWRFGTSTSGDFETMVRDLKPTVAAPSLGGTTVNIDRSGMGLDDLFLPHTNNSTPPTTSPPKVTQKTVEMEGALQPPSFAPVAPQDYSTSNSPFSTPGNPLGSYSYQLKNILNFTGAIKKPLASLLADISSTSSVLSLTNPFAPTKLFKPLDYSLSQPIPVAQQEDPVVLPPLYGKWHANQDTVMGQSPTWFQQVNLDPRYRIAAGLGAQIVQENQNNFLEAAWKQIGEVTAVNDRINKALAAREVSKAIYDKHLIGDINVTGAVDGRMDTLLKLSTPALKNILYGNKEVVSLAAKKSLLSEAATLSSFRKMTRSKAGYVQKMEKNSTTLNPGERLTTNMATQINDTSISPAGVPQQPINIYGIDILDNVVNYNYATSSYHGGPTNANYSIPPLSSPKHSVYIDSYENLTKTVEEYQDRQDKYVTKFKNPIDPVQLVDDITKSLDPAITIPARTWTTIRLQYNGALQGGPTDLKPIMAYPVIDEPMYKYLQKLSEAYILPHVDQYPNNTLTALKPNDRFIQSFMLGANQEFAKELLWQEYPTDQRGSYFRQFWDVNDTIANPALGSESLYDIDAVHKWTGALGSNVNSLRVGGSSYLVLLIRGEFLKKFPNTLIYLQKAVGIAPTTTNSAPPRTLNENYLKPDKTIDNNVMRFPVFKAYIQPDIALIGFSISESEAKGSDVASDSGWFFVFQERPGQLRFGLDEKKPSTQSSSLSNWDDLSWEHMTTNIARMDGAVDPSVLAANNYNTIQWNKSAADNASILVQKPVKMAVHADDLLP